jgi:hypothetical protein
MMLLVFYPTDFDSPTAVFWAEGESLRSHIVIDNAETRSAMYILMSKNPDSTWEEMFNWLGDQMPGTHRFDAYKVKAGTSPVAFLEDLRSRSRAS